jgi:HrpA-like RNA helicase
VREHAVMIVAGATSSGKDDTAAESRAELGRGMESRIGVTQPGAL